MAKLWSMLRRHWFASSIVICVVSVVLLDIVLHVATGMGSPVMYENDSACGYLPVPNQNVRRFGALNAINPFSQRSEDLPASKVLGHFRVLLVGDSVTYGTTYVDQHDIFASVLAKELPSRLHRPVDVLNAAVGAWAVSNEVGYLKSRGTFDADLVIFVLNTGDLNQPFNPGVLTPTSGYPSEPPLCALSEAWIRYLQPRLAHRMLSQDAGSTATTQPTLDPQQVLADLDRAKAISESSHARFAVVYSPCVGDEWGREPYPQSIQNLKKWASNAEVPLLDLQTAFAKAPPAEVYFDGVHLRPKGNQFTADAIEQWLQADAGFKSLLASRGSPKTYASQRQ